MAETDDTLQGDGESRRSGHLPADRAPRLGRKEVRRIRPNAECLATLKRRDRYGRL